MIESALSNTSESSADRAASLRKWLVIAILPLAVVYLSMLNRYWVPSGDGEVYTCIARSLARGEGLMFNGSRAAIAPPGWPIVLSLAMRISAEFWFLKLITTFSMLGAMASAFFTLRRFVTDRASAGVILLSGLLSSVYPLTFWMHTEAFFCLLGFNAILIAFRISEGRAKLAWEVPLMLFLLGFGAFTRWPGVLQIVLVVPVLMGGSNRPWRRFSIWVIALLSVAVSVGTFKATYSYLSLTKEEKQLALKNGGTSESESDVEVTPDPTATTEPTSQPTTAPIATTGADSVTPGTEDLRGNNKRTLPEEILYRVGTAGKWFAWLLWQPTRFGQSVAMINITALAAGWLAIAMLLLALIRGVSRHQYFWIGLALYTGGLCLLWPNPNARYFVPVAPFIVLGVLIGIQVVSDWTRRSNAAVRSSPVEGVRQSSPSNSGAPTLGNAAPSISTMLTQASHQIASIHVRTLSVPAKILMVVFVVATLISNLPLLAIDISVFRSRDFYSRYEAGSNRQLIIIAQYIRENPKGTVAVGEAYNNMGRERWSKFGQRALHLLTDREVLTPPRKKEYRDRPKEKSRTRQWARREAVAEYFVFQTDWDPWRVWHFRLSPSLQSRLSHMPEKEWQTGGWELYGRFNANYPRVKLDSQLTNPPTRVPGL